MQLDGNGKFFFFFFLGGGIDSALVGESAVIGVVEADGMCVCEDF
jgi:hypothetical protein